MYYSQTARLAIYAPGEFAKGKSKTAEGVIRYGKNPIAAVIDSSEAGKTVHQVLKVDSQAPIVASIGESLPHRPEALLLGTAWIGGQMPPEWRQDIVAAIESGMDVINGLHDFLSDDPEISRLASLHQRRLLDVRRPPDDLPVAAGRALNVPAYTVLTVGSDCSVGKMTTSLELLKEADKAGYSAKFVATGQTGIMISGQGIAIDRVIGDFMAGATEQMVVDAGFGHDFVFVEGQGSLIHPGFSGVTMALLHGAAPKALVLCHKAVKTFIGGDSPFPIPPLSRLVPLYEEMSAWLRPAKVVAVAVNTSGLSDSQARQEIAKAESDTGLTATDPIRFGAGPLFEAIVRHKELTE